MLSVENRYTLHIRLYNSPIYLLNKLSITIRNDLIRSSE